MGDRLIGESCKDGGMDTRVGDEVKDMVSEKLNG